MKTVTTIIDGHEMEVPEHLMAVEFKPSLINDIPRTYDEIKRMKESHDDLAAALKAIMTMDVKGHQLQDRLQFSDKGRALLDQCNAALAKAGAL